MQKALDISFGVRATLIGLVCCASAAHPDGGIPELGHQLDAESARVTAVLIGRLAGQDSSAAFTSLSRPDQAAFLNVFWKSHNPLLHKYYYAPHLGRRRFNVSDFS
jgi:hypothetical protein